ncbi:NAD(P)/FAD-dependent oxidoreductase [Nocardia sp. NPDC006044]|uniref:NAD(P)/FAD-dependent oxidoreductase n=1 Tax=Nocardia sp. NPDC006044 TaxID=3364306 RepID=UPI0036A1E8B5
MSERAVMAVQQPKTAEVVIIGGGIVGISTALQLAKRGVRDVVVVERRQLGAGATGKSGALIRCHYANVPEARLAHESLRIFRAWGDEVGAGSPGFDPVGFLRLVAPRDEARLRANVAAQQAIGIETSVVTADELRAIEPLIRTDDLTVAAFEPGSGVADPNGALYGLAEAARKLGVTILTDTPAARIVTGGDRVAGVVTSAGPISTGTVVLAAGAWSDRLLRPLGLDFGLVPVRSQVVIFRWPATVDPSRKHRVLVDSTRGSWFRPEDGAGTLVGLGSAARPADPDEADETIDAPAITRARAVLAHRFPGFAAATMRGGWAGAYMRSPDGHPIIDQVPAVPGLWVMTGDSGTSFKTAPAIGICLAEWITEGAPELVDLTPFRSTRFLDGQPWVDDNPYTDAGDLSASR